jgi:hypothetical protein
MQPFERGAVGKKLGFVRFDDDFDEELYLAGHSFSSFVHSDLIIAMAVTLVKRTGRTRNPRLNRQGRQDAKGKVEMANGGEMTAKNAERDKGPGSVLGH